MLKILLKACLSISVLIMGLNAQEFDPTKVELETEKLVKDIYTELDLKDLKLGSDFKILPSQMLQADISVSSSGFNSYKRFEPIYSFLNFSGGKIYINERILNQLSLEEKRYLIGKALAVQAYLKKNKNLSAYTIMPSCFALVSSGIIFAVESARSKIFTPIKTLSLIAGIISAGYLGDAIIRIMGNSSKVTNKITNKLTSHDGAISYLNKLLKLVKEKKIVGLSEKEINSEIKKIEELKKENENKVKALA